MRERYVDPLGDETIPDGQQVLKILYFPKENMPETYKKVKTSEICIMFTNLWEQLAEDWERVMVQECTISILAEVSDRVVGPVFLWHQKRVASFKGKGTLRLLFLLSVCRLLLNHLPLAVWKPMRRDICRLSAVLKCNVMVTLFVIPVIVAQRCHMYRLKAHSLHRTKFYSLQGGGQRAHS